MREKVLFVKMVALLLAGAVLLSWMAGCANSPDAAVPTDPAVSVDPSSWPKVAKDYAASPIMEAEPDREFYISLQNQDCDFYPGASYNGVFFFIITKDAYNLEEIEVDFPGETGCRVIVSDYSSTLQDISRDRESGSYGPDGQMPYHYLCMQNVDLQALAQKQSDASYASAAYNKLVESNLATQEDFLTLFEEYVIPYNNLCEEYINAYTAQPAQSIADHSAYLVNLIFEPKFYADETVEYIDVTLGGNTHRLEFGQWRFHQENWLGADQTHKGITLYSLGVVGVSDDSPYAQGYLRTPDALRFKTTEDIILTGLRCSDGTDATVLGAKIVSTSENGSMDFLWDGSGPVQMKANTSVSASVYFYSERFKEYEMNMTTVIYVDYMLVSTGEAGSFAMPCNFPRANNIWDTYCLAFLGVDVGEYYHYIPGDMQKISWISEIPEGWRNK